LKVLKLSPLILLPSERRFDLIFKKIEIEAVDKATQQKDVEATTDLRQATGNVQN
jgi:hypothetical protein